MLPQKLLLLFLLFLRDLPHAVLQKKRLCLKLNWNYWLEMGSLAKRPDLLGIHINGIISAAPHKA